MVGDAEIEISIPAKLINLELMTITWAINDRA